MHTFSLNHPGQIYTVAYVDYPKNFVQQTDAQTILENAALGAAANVNGQLLELQDITLGSYAGKEMLIEITGSSYFAESRIVLVGQRFYQALTVQAGTKTAQSRQFLESFRLIEP
jgi:hypothetical protein